MEPIKFEGHNVVLAENQEEYQPLPAYKVPLDKQGTIITEWNLTKEERAAINSGVNLRLAISTFNQPLQPLLPYIEEQLLKNPDNLLPSSVKMVKEFQDLFEKPISRVIGEEPLNIRQLRIKLLFEELHELSQAGDVAGTFAELCEKHLEKLGRGMPFPEDGDNVDVVEEADALADLQYVLDGKKLTSGLYIHMEEVFEVVHKNNMTKAHRSEAHCLETVNKTFNIKGGYQTVERAGLWFLYNGDGKLTKPWDHQKVSIKPIIFGK